MYAVTWEEEEEEKKSKLSRHRKHWNTNKNPKEISSRETEDQLEHYEKKSYRRKKFVFE
jgi:hypothetical protein